MRAVLLVVLLAACGGRNPPVATPPPSVDDPPDETAGSGAGSGSAATPSDAATDAGSASASGSGSGSADPGSTPAAPAVAHCLYVGPDQQVVRCYWQRKDCEAQIDFNKESGVASHQECRPTASVFCLTPSASTETCYPTAADCDHMYARLQARHRDTSACAEKTGP